MCYTEFIERGDFLLEVVNLTKIYKTKGGQDVHALDGVSLRFPTTGMVFLLGKSGSGKSTLLNVCGGLDTPSGGEIIVKGRSSKSFSQSDFDSYRNTFIGFIFQEYNILNEFTVEDNIALALELQGKSKDKEAIANLLKQVDLEGLAKRKPSTLSGGQKQRIAIARALIKSPEIIMADEPTGALDSNTGKQVLDTLKRLSETKLVIVVSHDRDFAEQYGDRIIELKDGKVISDVSKTTEINNEISENVTIAGSTICIKDGANLTDSEFDKIKDFLKSSSNNVVISNDSKDVPAFKEIARINDDGEKEIFVETDESLTPKPEYTKEDSKFIRSKLPLKHAIKIGASSLKTKPFRLFFTIFLCVVAFTMLGLFSTLTFYNEDATFTQTLKDSDLEYVRLRGYYKSHVKSFVNGALDWEYDSQNYAPISNDKLSSIKELYGNGVFGALQTFSSFNASERESLYYHSDISYIAVYNESIGLTITGNIPSKPDEICISSYTAEAMQALAAYDYNGNKITVDSPEKLIGQRINMLGSNYTVVGIFDSGKIPSKYDSLKEGSVDYTFINDYDSFLSDGLYKLVFVNEEQILNIASRTNTFDQYKDYSTECFIYFDASNKESYSRGYYYSLNDVTNEIIYINGKSEKDLGAVVSYQTLLTLLSERVEAKCIIANDAYHNKSSALEEKKQYYIDTLASELGNSDLIYEYLSCWETYLSPEASEADKNNLPHQVPPTDEKLLNAYNGFKSCYNEYLEAKNAHIEANNLSSLCWQLSQGEKEVAGSYISFTYEEKIQGIYHIIEKIGGFTDSIEFKLCDNQVYEPFGEAKIFEIVGFTDIDAQAIYLADDVFNELWSFQKGTTMYYTESTTSFTYSKDDIYPMMFIPYNGGDDLTENLLSIYKADDFDENDFRYAFEGYLFYELDFVNELIDALSKVFLWVGIVMAVFAVLLLSNFITMSITNKQREIGILRAVGARGSDIFKIFFSESFIIAGICTVISIAISIVLCGVLNSSVSEALGASIFNFGILSIGTIVILALLTSFVATFLPVKSVASKKPVDSIRTA